MEMIESTPLAVFYCEKYSQKQSRYREIYLKNIS
jgi:hypothetical protein